MGIIEGIILGAIQGISEFLPISSDGHLALFGHLLLPAGAAMDLFTTVLLHLGTLAAVLIVFAREAFPVFLSPFTAVSAFRANGLAGLKRHAPLVLLGLVLLGSIPAAVIGLLFEKQIEELTDKPFIVALFLAINGLMLLLAHLWSKFRQRRHAGQTKQTPGAIDTVLIGIGQAAAILPGISRSGSTISIAVARGVSRESAGVFSFLLFIPAIAGAALLQILKLAKHGSAELFNPVYHITGFLTALVVGYFALRLLVRMLKTGHFHWFGWYCLVAAAVWAIAL